MKMGKVLTTSQSYIVRIRSYMEVFCKLLSWEVHTTELVQILTIGLENVVYWDTAW